MPMRGKLIPVITLGFAFFYYLFTLATKGFQYLETDIITGVIYAISILILPALISKVILRKRYFGIGYIIGTIIYPVIYLSAYILNQQFSIDVELTYKVASLIVLFSSMYLFLIDIYLSNIYQARKLSKAMIAIFIVIVLSFGIRSILNLKNDSGLSLDFLQHNAVSMQIAEGRLCLVPNQCSSLFKQLGYTSFFHTIQTILTVGFNTDLAIAETAINIAFTVVCTLTIFSFFQKHIKDDETSLFATLISISLFELGAYSFNFFLPQTFALLLFLNIMSERNLKWRKIFLTLPFILASHFVFGPFFAILIVIYQLFFNDDIIKKNKSVANTVSIISLIGVIIIFIANLRGLSIEKLIQQESIAELGFATNFYYPDNLIFLLRQYGLLLPPLIISILYFIFRKEKSNSILFSIFYISFCLICYFLAPTYANKFLLGSSVFMVFLITNLFIELSFKRFTKILFLFLILLSVIPIKLINLSNYITFYTQNSGEISSDVEEDTELVSFLKVQEFDCQILSDPYTQLVVSAKTQYDTAGGQYQDIGTRSALVNLIDDPTETNYENLLSSKEIAVPFCILLSSRLYTKDMYLNYANVPWLNSLYEYEIDNDYGLGSTSYITQFLEKKGFLTYYTDSNFKLFVPQ